MGEAAVTFLLEQVKDVVKEYKDLISGAENEFNQLQNELGLVKAFLNDAAKAKKDYFFKEMEKQIREVVYEVEDSITTWLNKAIQAKARSSRRPALSRANPTSLAEMVNSITREKVMPMFDQLKLRFASMQIADGSQGEEDPRTKSPTKRDQPIRKIRVVGFEDEEDTITGYLLQEKQGLEVIPIIGIPGQGKTTLALKVYQNETMCFNFPIRIWICISQIFNSRDVFLHILKSFAPSLDTSKMEYDDLVQTVRSCLEKEKFLLVLDDVWSVDAWEEIKGVLPVHNGNGKVLITSREMNVGRRSCTVKPHELKFLNESESWELLQYEVYGNAEDCPQELRGVGRYLANKCDGVPLTIIVIGGILIDQLITSPSTAVAVREWKAVAEDVSSALENEQRITDVVALSYERLPNDLRDCFVYIGVFPEDYEIPVKTLSELWIAEGLILPKEGRSLEESAEHNLNDLITRNLLGVEKTNHTGKVKTCRVHDMVRAFCIAKSKGENLFQEIKVSKTGGEVEPPVSEVQKLHRLCLHSGLSNFLSQRPKGPHVRSLLCFDKQFVEKPEYISTISEGFHLLRILEFKSIKLHKLPSKFVKLIHLRYLTLCIGTLTILPEAISELWNLQSIIVETGSHSITMKANLWRMIQLRHFKINAAVFLDDKWEGEAGHNLQTLYRLSPESCTEAVSRRAKYLKTLGISGKLANFFETNFLEKLHHLEKLKVVNSLTFDPSEDLLHRLPQTNCFPPYLRRLTLMKTSLDWQHISTLAMIRSLEVLKLKDNAFLGVSWNASGYNFPNLQLLLIVNTDLVLWEASTDSFPSLMFLVLKSCESLIEIPLHMGTHLEKLDIERLRKTAVESARKIRDSNMGRPQGKFAVPFILKQCPVCENM